MMIEFHHGVLCDKYEDQVKAQGFTYGTDADYIQQIGDNIIWLWMQDIFTDSVYDKVLQRFQKKYLTSQKYLKKTGGEKNEQRRSARTFGKYIRL